MNIFSEKKTKPFGHVVVVYYSLCFGIVVVLLNVKILKLTQFSSSRAAAAGGSDAVLHHYTVGPPVVAASARLGVVVDLFSCSIVLHLKARLTAFASMY